MQADVQARLGRDGQAWRLAVVFAFILVPLVSSKAEEVADGQEIQLLRRQVVYLSESLGGAKAELDALKARQDSSLFDLAGGSGVEGVVELAGLGERQYKILEISRELGMAVLNAGRRQGIRPGLEFAVMRGDKVLATLKVIDVRAAIAGAVVLRTNGAYPRAQDRAVLVAGSKE